MEEERQRKLQAGKEKFALLMKKKHSQVSNDSKKKRQKRSDPSPVMNDETANESTSISEEAALTESTSSCSEGFDEMLSEKEHLVPDITASCGLTQESSSAAEVIIPVVLPSTGDVDTENHKSKEADLKIKFEEYNKKILEYRSALEHRDEIISQLTLSLQASLDQRDILQGEATTQADTLAMQINMLKLQLQQASEILRTKNGISAQELLDARNLVIDLQQDNLQKEESIRLLTGKNKELVDVTRTLELGVQQLHKERNHLNEKNETLVVDINKYLDFKNQLENRVREQDEQFRKCQELLQSKNEECQLMNVKMKSMENSFAGAQNNDGQIPAVQQGFESHLKALNEKVLALTQERDDLATQIPKCKSDYNELNLKMKNMIQEHDFVKNNLKRENEQLNSCLYHARRESDLLKTQHVSEIRRIQMIHREDLDHMRTDAELRYKQTVNDLNGKLKQMQNELLSLKGIATELEVSKQKHLAELEDIHLSHQKSINNYECEKQKLIQCNHETENKIKEMEIKFGSMQNDAALSCGHCKELGLRLRDAQNELHVLREQKKMVCDSALNDEDVGNYSAGLDININLDDITKEIMSLKAENEHLKLALKECSAETSSEHSCDKNSVIAVDLTHDFMDDASKTSDDDWKWKYESLLEDKLSLEMQLQSLDSVDVEKETKLIAECDLLRSKCQTLNELESKCTSLLNENNVLRLQSAHFEELLKQNCTLGKLSDILQQQEMRTQEQYSIQVNNMERIKNDLENQLQETMAQCDELLRGKQTLEQELLEKKLIFEPKSNSESYDVSEFEQIIEEKINAENQIAFLKMKLCHESESQAVLDKKVKYFNNQCTKYMDQILELKQNTGTLHEELDTSLKHQGALLNQLQEAQQNHLNAKLGYEKEMTALRSQLSSLVNKSEGEHLNIAKAYSLGNGERLESESGKLPLGGSVKDLEGETAMDEMELQRDEVDNELYMNAMELDRKIDWQQENNASDDGDLLLLCNVKEQRSVLEALQKTIGGSQNEFHNELKDFIEHLVVLHSQQSKILLQLHHQRQPVDFSNFEKKDIFEETLRQEKEILQETLQEQNTLDTMCLKQKLELEKLKCEIGHLQEMIVEKDKFEQDLIRQRHLLEEQLAEMEQRLQKREINLENERIQLQMELRRKDLLIHKWRSDFKEKQVEYQHLHSYFKAEQSVVVATMYQQFQQEGLSRVEQLKSEMDQHHTVAIEQLKQNLQNQFAVRETKLLEQYSFQVAQLQEHHKQQITKLLADFEDQLMTLKTNSNSATSNKTEISEMYKIQTELYAEIEKLQSTLNEVQTRSFDQIKAAAEKMQAMEIEELKQQTNIEMTRCLQEQKRNLTLLHDSEIKALEATYESAKHSLVANVKDEMDKLHKNELNKTIQNWQSRNETMQQKCSDTLALILGVNKMSSKSVFSLLQQQVIQEFQTSVQNLIGQWETKYLTQLATLRDEIEEKFKKVISQTSSFETAGQVPSTSEEFTEEIRLHTHGLLEEKEEIIKKTTEMRQRAEDACDSEIQSLKEHLQKEFEFMRKMQEGMKEDIESNQSPTLIELHKIKEDYEILQEKYEEITREQIEVKEYVIKKPAIEESTSVEVAKELMESESLNKDETLEAGTKITVGDDVSQMKAALEKKYANDLDQLRIYFEKQCQNMEDRYAEEIKSLKMALESGQDDGCNVREQTTRPPTLTHFCDAYSVESNVMDVEDHYKKEFHTKLQQYREQLDDERKELEEQHASEVKSLQKECQLKIQREIDSTRMELANTYTQQIEALIRQNEESMVSLQKKYADDLAKEVSKVHLQCTSEVGEQIERECIGLHEKLKLEHDNNLKALQNELEAKHKKELEIIHAHLQAEKAEEINAAVTELRQNLQKQRDEIQSNISSSAQDIFVDEMSDLASRCAIEKAVIKEEWTKENEATKRNTLQVEEHERDLEKCKSELAAVLLAKSEDEQKHLNEIESLTAEIVSLKEESERKTEVHEMNTQTEMDVVDPDIENMHATAAKEQEILLEALKEQYQEEIKSIQAMHAEALTKLEDLWKQKLNDELLQERDNQHKEQNKEMEKMILQHQQELADERVRLHDELTADHITKFEAVTRTITGDHQQELEDLRQNLLREHEETIGQLRHDLHLKEKEFQLVLQELKENHEKDVEDLNQKYSQQIATEIQKAKHDMEGINEDKLQAVALDTEVLKSELEATHRREILELQEKLSRKHHEEMENELKKTIQEMDDKHKKILAKVQDDQMKELICLRQELEEAMESQLEKHQKIFQDEKEAELTSIRTHYEEKLAQICQSSENADACESDSETTRNKKEDDEIWQTLSTSKERVEALNIDDEFTEARGSAEADVGQGDFKRQRKDTCNLLNSLQQEIEKLKLEQDDSNRKTEHLKMLLSDMLKSYVTVEMMINKQLIVITRDDEESLMLSPAKMIADQDNVEIGFGESLSSEPSASSVLTEDVVDMEYSSKIPDNIFSDTELGSTTDEIIRATNTNLTSAVKRLLNLLTLTVQHCHESKLAQLELVNTAAHNGEEAAMLLSKTEDLKHHLQLEIQAKDALTLELHKAAGLMSGLESDKSKMEQAMLKQDEVHRSVIEQLEQSQNRIRELEERAKDQNDHLEHQRALLAEGLGEQEQLKSDVIKPKQNSKTTGLLNENLKLYESNKDLQRQSEKDRQQLNIHVHSLEQAMDEEVFSKEQLLTERMHLIEDLRQQVEALEKQLRANRQFIEEQTFEREQEREESQRQIEKLQSIVRDKSRQQSTECWLTNEVEMLTEQLQNKDELIKNSTMKKEAAESQIKGLEDKIKDMSEIIKNLETQLDSKTQTESSLNEEMKNLKNALDETTQAHEELIGELEVLRNASSSSDFGHIQLLEEQLEARGKELETLNSSQSLMQELRCQIFKIEEKVEKKTKELEALQLSVSSVSSPSSEDVSLRDQLEIMRSMRNSEAQEIVSPLHDMRRLEDKLEALAKAEEAAVKKTRDLEMLLKKYKNAEEELVQDRDALQEQVGNQLLQISSLQARIEDKRHHLNTSEASLKIVRLQENIDKLQEIVEKKESETEDLRDQVKQLKQHLVTSENEIARLMSEDDYQHLENKKQDFKKENEELKKTIHNLQEELCSIQMPLLTQSLLNEKNQEIDDLVRQLEELRLHTDNLEDNHAKELLSNKSDAVKIESSDNLASRIDALEAKLKEKEQECDKLKYITEANKGEIEGLHLIASEKENVEVSLQAKEAELKKYQDIAEQRKREVDALRSVLKEKEELLVQVSTLRAEQKELLEFQYRLQEDYDTVQSMLEDNQKELMAVQQQLLAQENSHRVEQHVLEVKNSEQNTVMRDKDNEIQELKKRLDLLAQNGALKQDELEKELKELRSQLSEKNESLEVLRRQSHESDFDFGNRSEEMVTGHFLKEESVTQQLGLIGAKENVSSEEKLHYKSKCDVLESELEAAKSREESLRVKLSDAETSLKEIGDEKERLQKKISLSQNELHALQKQLRQFEQLQKENDRLQDILQARKDVEAVSSSKELASIKNEILKVLETNLKTIHQQLSKQPDSSKNKDAFESSKEKLPELTSLEQELVKTRGELQQLQFEIQKLPKQPSDKEQRTENGSMKVDDHADLQMRNNQREILEAEAVLSRSEIDRLHDQIEQYELSTETLKEQLNLEKEEHKKETELLRQSYKQEMDVLRSALTNKLLQLSSDDSGSHSDNSQNLPIDQSRVLPDSEHEEVINTVPKEVHALLKKVHKEGVEMLSLSELLFLRSHGSHSQQMHVPKAAVALPLQHAWENEKRQLLSEIMALKELLSQATEASASLRTTGVATTELSNLLLQTVAAVFERERAVILAELRTQILSSNLETPDEFKRLEHRLIDMECNQKGVLEKVQTLLENSRTVASIDTENRKEIFEQHQEQEKLLTQIAKLEEDARRQEAHLKRQVELLEYRLKQEQMYSEEIRRSLDLEKKRTLELTSHLSREKGANADLEMSSSLMRTEFIKYQAALDKDKREIQNLKIAMESERFRSVALNQALESEQANFNQLQEAMEAEKRRSKTASERQQQIIQEYQHALEKSKESHVAAVSALDRERLNLINVNQELEHAKHKLNVDTLKSTRSAKSKNIDMSHLHNDFNRIQELTLALERERQRVASITNTLSEERAASAEDMDRERTTNLQLQKNCHVLKEQNFNLIRELQEEKERGVHLESERIQMQKQLTALRDDDSKRSADRETERQLEYEHHREIQLLLERERQKQQEQKLEHQKMMQKIHVLEKELQQFRDSEAQLRLDVKHEREQNSALAGKKKLWASVSISNQHVYDNHTLEAVKQQLQCFLLKCRIEMENVTTRRDAGDNNQEDVYKLIRLLLKEIETIKLDRLPIQLEKDEELQLTQFAEQVLHQNAELIGFVSKLCEDKMGLRKLQSQLEDELVELRHKEISSEQVLRRSLNATKELLTTERASWAEEKAALQLAVHKAEARLAQFSSDSKAYNLLQSQESLANNAIKADTKWQQWYLKYRRAESYRKALVYQKKYLLILLGDFQDTEATTLAMIAQVGIPTKATIADEMRKKNPILRFRSCVQVLVAIYRMKILSYRWKRVPHPSSSFGSAQELRSPSTSQANIWSAQPLDLHYKRVHRVGTTPPVKDWCSESTGRAASDKSSSSSIRRNLSFTSLNANLSLQPYLERMDSLHQQLGISVHSERNKSQQGGIR